MRDARDLPAFIRAVRENDLATVRLMAGAAPSLLRATDPDCFGATAIIRAVEADSLPMVDLLLELGADIDQRSDWWAGSFGVLDSAGDEMAASLLRRGATLTPHAAAQLGKIAELRAMLTADPSIAHARGGDGQTPLHFACSTEIADLLLSHGAQIDALDIDHASTPAQWLCTSRPHVASHLLAHGAAADPFLAARIGDVSTLEKTVNAEPTGVRVRVSRERFFAPPPAAGHIYLYTIGEGSTLLHAAAAADQSHILRWLGAHGADVNARGGYDDATPLHVAAWNDKPAAIGALLDVGADINAKSGHLHRNEPLGWAIVSGAVDAFRVLLERGALVQPWHRENVRQGVDGAFRPFNPRRPIDVWRTISLMLDPEP